MVAGLLAACPIWLFQLWQFIVPALLEKEKKYARNFLISAIPLFLAGLRSRLLRDAEGHLRDAAVHA